MLLNEFFPKLNASNHRITSDPTGEYNCIAWAAGCSDKWWDPIPNPRYFWPKDIPPSDSVETLCRTFESLGYTKTENEIYEQGFEKVAIYGDQVGFTHAARQLPTGKWTSKLGDWEDIEHDTLEALEGEFYGKAVQILKRAVT
jgi:hypothetical protein